MASIGGGGDFRKLPLKQNNGIVISELKRKSKTKKIASSNKLPKIINKT